MAGALQFAAITLFAVWLAWNVYRHVAVYLVRGRIVVVTDRVLGNLVLGAAGIGVALARFPADVVIFVLGVGAATALWRAELWLVVGATPERIFERAGLVLRGMGFRFDETKARTLEEREGRIRVWVAASLASRTHVLRLRSARAINKVALFRVNLRKFLVAIPRERR
jgi:hypothetical protein